MVKSKFTRKSIFRYIFYMLRWAPILLLVQASCFSLRGFQKNDDLGPVSALCGNDVLDADEACDGTRFRDAQTCLVNGAGPGGLLTCTERCKVDTQPCLVSTDALRLWLFGSSADGGAKPVDRGPFAHDFSFLVDGAAATNANVFSLSSDVAITLEHASGNERAYAFAQGAGHNVFVAQDIIASTPLTYELWLAPAASTHAMTVFAHENGCTLTLVAVSDSYRARATCGFATAQSNTVISADAYTFVSLQVAKAELQLSVGGQVTTATNAPVFSGSGRFGLANTLVASPGIETQFVGRIDELRVFEVGRTASELCSDEGKVCP